MTLRIVFALAVLAIFAAPAARAQTAPSPSPSPSASPAAVSDPCGSIISIVTRPTVTTSVCTVRPRKALIETGYTNTTVTGAAGGTSVSYPQALIRIGSGDPRLEYDLIPPSANVSSIGGTVARGASDLGFGLKSELGYTSAASWGVNAYATLPTGAPAFTAGSAQYTANFNGAYTLNPTLSLAGTVGYNSLAGTNANNQLRRFSSIIPSLTLSASYPANSEFFVEYVYFSQAGPGLGSRTVIDYGFIRDLGPHVQVDVEAGVQPTAVNGQRAHYVGAGLSLMN
jgi:hypothetical protein